MVFVHYDIWIYNPCLIKLFVLSLHIGYILLVLYLLKYSYNYLELLKSADLHGLNA